MRTFLALALHGFAVVLSAQGIDLHTGLPNWGLHTSSHHYLPDWQGAQLPTVGTHWSWQLDSVAWVDEGLFSDTVWHHSASLAPKDGGNFSVYDQHYLTYRFYHASGDTLMEDSAWVISQGTTEINYPPVPVCWQGQTLGDSTAWYDQVSGVDRHTCFRATLDLRTPWGELNGLLVFEDRVLEHVTYRIHRPDDLVRELARYVVLDGLYVNWPVRH